MSGPLDGMTILDFTRYQQGPSATLMLAELGARVLKVESPDGDPGRLLSRFEDGFPCYFEVLNRGKQSIVVDLRQPDGKAVIARLARQVDMLAQDPQALENSYLYNYEHPRFGTLQAVGPVAYFSKTAPVLQGPAPEEPGQHTQAILANAGFTADEIGQLRANKVVS